MVHVDKGNFHFSGQANYPLFSQQPIAHIRTRPISFYGIETQEDAAMTDPEKKPKVVEDT
jgi:hypothetical protein